MLARCVRSPGSVPGFVRRAGMNSIRVSVVLAGLLAAVLAHAAASDPPRLKYRARGPVCSCASGLDENEIRKAWEARFGSGSQSQAAPTPAPGGGSAAAAPGPQRHDQQREEGK